MSLPQIRHCVRGFDSLPRLVTKKKSCWCKVGRLLGGPAQRLILSLTYFYFLFLKYKRGNISYNMVIFNYINLIYCMSYYHYVFSISVRLFLVYPLVCPPVPQNRQGEVLLASNGTILNRHSPRFFLLLSE